MVDLYEKSADHFMELASPHRLEILFRLLEKKSTITGLAKELDTTKQEMHRHFTRLEDSKLIQKDIDSNYFLTTFGKTMCTQVPSLVFLSQNMDYFEDHDFGDVPTKFIMRSGQLAGGKRIKGVVKALEQWKQIYKNANEYIYEALYEVPLDLIEPLFKRPKDGVKINYIFSQSAITPKGRKELLKKIGINKLIDKGIVERKMKDKISTVVVLNEKEACILFPDCDGEPDMSEMFYGNDPMFHEWCLDYFRYCWYGSDVFEESKLKEE
jgi:predicted transcriptional regulator